MGYKDFDRRMPFHRLLCFGVMRGYKNADRLASRPKEKAGVELEEGWICCVLHIRS
jgi:hypothetical protein